MVTLWERIYRIAWAYSGSGRRAHRCFYQSLLERWRWRRNSTMERSGQYSLPRGSWVSSTTTTTIKQHSMKQAYNNTNFGTTTNRFHLHTPARAGTYAGISFVFLHIYLYRNATTGEPLTERPFEKKTKATCPHDGLVKSGTNYKMCCNASCHASGPKSFHLRNYLPALG